MTSTSIRAPAALLGRLGRVGFLMHPPLVVTFKLVWCSSRASADGGLLLFSGSPPGHFTRISASHRYPAVDLDQLGTGRAGNTLPPNPGHVIRLSPAGQIRLSGPHRWRQIERGYESAQPHQVNLSIWARASRQTRRSLRRRPAPAGCRPSPRLPAHRQRRAPARSGRKTSAYRARSRGDCGRGRCRRNAAPQCRAPSAEQHG